MVKLIRCGWCGRGRSGEGLCGCRTERGTPFIAEIQQKSPEYWASCVLFGEGHAWTTCEMSGIVRDLFDRVCDVIKADRMEHDETASNI